MIKEFKGIHEEGKSHNDVQDVQFFGTNVDFFPRGLSNHFPNLTHLTIICGGFKEISKMDLVGLEGLVHLQIRNSEMTSLPDDLFTAVPNLREVNFCVNKIEFASSEILKPLIGRKNVRVCLRKNKSIDA